jgi:hypothetical protein
MIDQPRMTRAQPGDLGRDERSMRVMEYAIAFTSLIAALLLSLN